MKGPRLTVDVIVTGKEGVLLIRRKNEPYKGKWALVGGFVNYGETVEQAAIRECKEEIGVEVKLKGLFGVFSDPERERLLNEASMARDHGLNVVILTEEEADEAEEVADETIKLPIPPDMPKVLTPLPFIIPLQLFAYYMSVKRGLNPDKPRNLAKSVTVK